MPAVDEDAAAAVVLAGARNDGALAEVSPVDNEALVPVGGRTLLAHVMAALEGAPVERVYVVGPVGLETVLRAPGRETTTPPVERLNPADSLADNVEIGLKAAEEHAAALLLSADIPLVDGDILCDTLARCRTVGADLALPVIERETMEARFPGGSRTYVTVDAGTFTAGNMVLLRQGAYGAIQKFLGDVAAFRKRPWRLAGILGIGFIVSLLLRRLRLEEVEARVSEIIGCPARAVPLPHPEVGFDVDKPEDAALVEAMMAFFPERQQADDV